MASFRLSFLLLAAIATVCTAQKAAPGPSPAGPLNLTAILEKGGQFSTFIRFLASTQVGDQVNSQVNHSTEGMTVFAPSDNAFQNLKAGAINSLTPQEQVQLIQYHVLPKCYTFDSFQTASNPVRTQASNDDGPFGLTITYLGVNSVEISTGLNSTKVSNALSANCPLTVYQVDKVLQPKELFGPKAKAPKSAPASSAPAKSKDKSDDKADAPAADEKNGAYGVRSRGAGIVALIGFVIMGLVF